MINKDTIERIISREDMLRVANILYDQYLESLPKVPPKPTKVTQAIDCRLCKSYYLNANEIVEAQKSEVCLTCDKGSKFKLVKIKPLWSTK